MGFADELRSMPEAKSLQDKKIWEDFILYWVEDIKRSCRSSAESGDNHTWSEFSYFITSIQKYPTLYDYSVRNTWEKISDRVSKPGIDEWSPRTVCLSECDAQELADRVKGILESEGLSVNCSLRKFEVFHSETKFFERDEKDRKETKLFNTLFPFNSLNRNEEGYYKKVTVSDGYRYDVELKIEW